MVTQSPKSSPITPIGNNIGTSFMYFLTHLVQYILDSRLVITILNIPNEQPHSSQNNSAAL